MLKQDIKIHKNHPRSYTKEKNKGQKTFLRSNIKVSVKK